MGILLTKLRIKYMDINKIERDEAIADFTDSNFQDENQHPLTNSIGFLLLVYKAYPIAISGVEKDGRSIEINPPVVFDLSFSGGLYLANCREFGLSTFAKELAKVQPYVEDSIFSKWQGYIYVPQSNVVTLKDQFIRSISEVIPN